MNHSAKPILILQHTAPYGKTSPYESLDVALAAASLEQKVSIVFLNDGVWQLKSKQNPAFLGVKTLANMLEALPLYDVNHIYVEQLSLQERGLSITDLVLPVTLINYDELGNLFDTHEIILNF